MILYHHETDFTIKSEIEISEYKNNFKSILSCISLILILISFSDILYNNFISFLFISTISSFTNSLFIVWIISIYLNQTESRIFTIVQWGCYDFRFNSFYGRI